MRILVVSHYFESHRGGVEIIAAELASRLASTGRDVVWAASGLAGEIVTPDLGVCRLSMRACNLAEEHLSIPYPVWSVRSLRELYRAVRDCDVVHLHDCLYFGSIVASIFARLCRKPVVITQHISEVPYSNRALRWLMRFSNRTVGRFVLANSRICVVYSKNVRDYIATLVPHSGRVRFISNGVDTNAFATLGEADRRQARASLGWPEDRRVCLFVGRFVEKKGLAILHELARRFSECKFVLVGWGRLDPRQWNLPNVEVVGSIDHARTTRYYQAADLVLLPSIGEGFPLVVQEAMACGTPVLISDETAAANPGLGGIAFTAPPTVSDMSAALESILDQPELLLQCRAAVAEFAQRAWCWESTAAEYARVLAEVCPAVEVSQ